ncbi:hypothetical protein LEP1GSC059_0447 [Leptospira noguchii serovar Panama str. CZ214]|uniref:Uncharacterized protein n=1 Tax=Leptospira noguchii serovar Panama str. CZ214 TaxID=1001595 RepID=T0GWH3_9LEPT|nr:hypothetical protein LEP1GSC059_0447 [Leptospira noguchii serovar Panama str. CZ214]
MKNSISVNKTALIDRFDETKANGDSFFNNSNKVFRKPIFTIKNKL